MRPNGQALEHLLLDAQCLGQAPGVLLRARIALRKKSPSSAHTDRPGCCRRYPDLLRAELIRSGVGPDPSHLLPGHRIRLVQALMPVMR